MTLDQIDRMVRQANPVPDLTALEKIDASVLDEQRRMDMQTHDRVIVDNEGSEPKRGRNLLIGIAAAAAISVGALLLLRPLTNDAPVAGSPTTITEAPSIATAVEVATAFVEAYAIFDTDTAASYLAPDADLSFLELFGGSWRTTNRLKQAQGWKMLLDSCIGKNATPTGAMVRCLYAFQDFRSDELGFGPFTGSWYDITVKDAKIVSVSGHDEFNNNGFAERVWMPFSEWVSQTYPEDAAIMYSNESLSLEAAEESIALWEQRTREYVTVVGG